VKNKDKITRRGIMARLAGGAGLLFLGGCSKMSESTWFPKVLGLGEKATHKIQRLIIPDKAMAREFPASYPDKRFKSNGTVSPNSAEYAAMAKGGFKNYRLAVGGLVESPLSFSLADIRRMPGRAQITRHDCVEGWSAVGKWKGARLGAILEKVRLKPEARYIVFHCADKMEENEDSFYYESIDMTDAFHPQTILAYELNDAPLPVRNGAPLRLRVERQLGYKMAKYVMRIEAVDDLSDIGRGNGGYWEDRGYEWYAGI